MIFSWLSFLVLGLMMSDSQVLNPILSELSKLQAQIEVGSRVEIFLGIQPTYSTPQVILDIMNSN